MLPREFLERFEQFSWGERDCVHFANAARALFGAEVVEIPSYGSKYEAIRVIAECGGLRQMLVERLGEPIHPMKAKLYDTVLTCFPSTGEVVGVADPPCFWLLAESGGFVPVSLELAVGVFPCRR